MAVQIADVYEKERGCGYRHSGFYLRTDPSELRECGKLPLKLEPCSCCGLKIKLTRGLQRINVQQLFKNSDCEYPTEACRNCLINRTGYGYLIGIGAKHYPSRGAFRQEAADMGISKRIAFPLPRDFKVRESVVLLGHPKVFTELVPENAIEIEHPEIDENAPQKSLPIIDGYANTTVKLVARDIPAVIALFVPQRIEYVVSDTEPEGYLERLVEQGLTLVRVHKHEEK